MDKLEATASPSWAADIIDAARSKPQHITPGDPDTFLVAVHRDFNVHDLEKHLPAPLRIREAIVLAEVTSFIDYWQTFAGDSSVILADLDGRAFRAVFDYHQPGKPSWGDHTATLALRHSTEWNTWAGRDGHKFEQEAFAEFIEANAIDIVQPAAAEMMQIALTLSAKTKVDFSSGVRLENGQVQLKYEEKIEGRAGPKGDMLIPDTFKLALRIFQGGEKYEVQAHLRYRINNGKLTFFYQLIRPQRLIEDAFDQVKKQVETGCQGANLLVTG